MQVSKQRGPSVPRNFSVAAVHAGGALGCTSTGSGVLDMRPKTMPRLTQTGHRGRLEGETGLPERVCVGEVKSSGATTSGRLGR